MRPIPRSRWASTGTAGSPRRARPPTTCSRARWATTAPCGAHGGQQHRRGRRARRVPATAGLFSNLIAWQQTPGSAGEPEIRMRYAPGGSGARSRAGAVLACRRRRPTPPAGSRGPATWQRRLRRRVAAGLPGATQIVAAQLYQPPGGFGPLGPPRYMRASPAAADLVAGERALGAGHLHGGARRRADRADDGHVDGGADGAHGRPAHMQRDRHQPGGQTSQSRTATVFVDTVPPVAQIAVQGDTLLGHAMDTVPRLRRPAARRRAR